MSQAKPGHEDGLIVALARLAWLKSQSQAIFSVSNISSNTTFTIHFHVIKPCQVTPQH
jgi:hypothetical protein